MAVKTVTEDEIGAFLSDLRAGDADKRVNLITHWGLKLEGITELPERGVDAITMLVGPFVRSPNHLLVTSTLNNFLLTFLPLIPTSPPSHLKLALSCILPGLIEKLNDPKERLSAPARECLGLLGSKAYSSESLTVSQGPRAKEKDGVVSQWEAAVKDALSGRAPRAKIEILKLLLTMRSDPNIKLPLKPWLASLVNLLEDSDGVVRDQAREAVVALLSPPTTPPAARTEFKKLLLARNVRKSIADAILTRILGGASVPSTPMPQQASAETSDTTRAPTPASEDVEVVYVAGARDLELEFKAMIPHFEGKETEHNWGPRERSLLRIRGMLRGKVFAKQPEAFLAGLKGGIVDGISRTLMSLRTTLAQQSCALVQELAETLGPSFDPSAEALLPTLGKMAGLTKRMIAERSQKGVDAIIKHSNVHQRILLSHINAAMTDKSAQARQYGATHLRTLLDSPNAKSILHDGLLDQVEQMVKRGLADVNPAVREQGRTTFWIFERYFSQPAAKILAGLDATARKQLERAIQQRPGTGEDVTPAVRPSPKPRASSAMSAMIAAKRAQVAAEKATATATQMSAEVAPQTSSRQPAARDIGNPPSASPPPVPAMSTLSLSRGPEPVTEVALGDTEAATPARSPIALMARRTASSPATPTRLPRPGSSRTPQSASPPPPISPASSAHTVSNRASSQKRVARLSREVRPPSLDRRQSDAGRSPPNHNAHNGQPSSSPVSRLSVLPRPIGTVMSGASSDVSGRSRSSSLARTLSRSPPGPTDSPLQAFRAPGSAAPAPRRVASAPLSATRPSITPRSTSSSNRPRTTQPPLIPEAHTYFAYRDPAEEARHAQAQQGLSAAKQLLEFDDDDDEVIQTAPMTPVRGLRGSNMATMAMGRGPLNELKRREWEDSPLPMTPKLIKKLENSGYERSWWTTRRKLLDEATTLSSTKSEEIEAEVAALVDQPSVKSLKRIARFSAECSISEASDQNNNCNRELWVENRLFDRILDGLLACLDPQQPPAILEQALVTLWELVQNQWALFEAQSREDALLDRLFDLRTSGDHTVLESTNAMVSLLVEVCNPPFLLSQLEAALRRFLVAHEGEAVSREGARVRTAGYTYALNAMGMCILKLPREAVEGEAKRRSHIVVESLNPDLAVSSRQAGNRVILAVQCMLQDDTRTLDIFPGLTSTQRDFATYQMSQSGLLIKVTEEEEAVVRRQSLHYQLVDGLAKGSRLR